MAGVTNGLERIVSYHAHIYYDYDSSRAAAEKLRTSIGERFRVQLGRWHDQPVGPHPRAMFQVAFDKELFAGLIPWLMLNRDGLTVFVHPNTNRPRADHAKYALWMGEVLLLDVSGLPENAEKPEGPVQANTTSLSLEHDRRRRNRRRRKSCDQTKPYRS